VRAHTQQSVYFIQVNESHEPQAACSALRPAALEALDANQVHVNINIPGPVRKAVDQEPAAYYFATVQRV
jgi:hypothetical protein